MERIDYTLELVYPMNPQPQGGVVALGYWEDENGSSWQYQHAINDGSGLTYNATEYLEATPPFAVGDRISIDGQTMTFVGLKAALAWGSVWSWCYKLQQLDLL